MALRSDLLGLGSQQPLGIGRSGEKSPANRAPHASHYCREWEPPTTLRITNMNKKENTLYVKAREAMVTIKNTSVTYQAVDLAVEAQKAMDSYYRCSKAASKNKRVEQVRKIALNLQAYGYRDVAWALASWGSYLTSLNNDNNAQTLAMRASHLMQLGVPAGCMKSLREMQQSLE